MEANSLKIKNMLDIERTDKAQRAFKYLIKSLKHLISHLICVRQGAFLVFSRGKWSNEFGPNQRNLIYYVCQVLKDFEINYSKIEKIAYALVITARRLKLCFQTHTINVLSSRYNESIKFS